MRGQRTRHSLLLSYISIKKYVLQCTHDLAGHILKAVKKRSSQKYSPNFVFSYESGILEDPANPGPDDLYQMTKDPKTSMYPLPSWAHFKSSKEKKFSKIFTEFCFQL